MLDLTDTQARKLLNDFIKNPALPHVLCVRDLNVMTACFGYILKNQCSGFVYEVLFDEDDSKSGV